MSELSMLKSMHPDMKDTSSNKDSTSIDGSLTEFHYFPELPIEMRSLVWRNTLPPSRIVLLCLERIPPKDDKHPEEFKLFSPCALPIALRVCKESRLEAQRHYCLAFPNQYHEGRIYIDFRCDTVYMVWKESHTRNKVDISPRKLRVLLDQVEADKIQNMAVSSIYSETPQELVQLQSFGGLKELSVEFDARELTDEEVDSEGSRQVILVEEEEFRMLNGQPPIDDMGVLDRAFVLEMFHEVRKAFPDWKAPKLRFISSGAEVI